jgi:hypothetical protein
MDCRCWNKSGGHLPIRDHSVSIQKTWKPSIDPFQSRASLNSKDLPNDGAVHTGCSLHTYQALNRRSPYTQVGRKKDQALAAFYAFQKCSLDDPKEHHSPHRNHDDAVPQADFQRMLPLPTCPPFCHQAVAQRKQNDDKGQHENQIV